MTFRSQDMKHYTMIIPRDHAYSTISQIAQLQSAHFIDAGDHMNRQFQPQLKRCEQLSQNINQMKIAAKQSGFKYNQYNQSQTGYMQKMIEIWKAQAKNIGVQDIKLIDYYQIQIDQQHTRYLQTITRLQKLKSRKKQLLQQIAIGQTIASFFGQSNLKQQSNQYYQNFVGGQGLQSLSGVSYIVGVIDRAAQIRFNRMIYRISRGYACTRSLDKFNFKGLLNFQQKVVMVIYPSSTSAILEKKIQKVMQMFCFSVTELDKYQLKSPPANNLKYLQTQFNQTQNYIQMNQAQLKAFFQRICQINCLQKWSTFVWKQKYIYQVLNKLQTRGQLMLGNIYIPKVKVKNLSIQLNRLSPAPTLQQVRLGNPPTAFNTNQYTSVAQQITDTYGIPRYKQMNPSIFTTITFPFFFGVMFGDIGHGGLLFGLGLYLVFNDQWIRKGNYFLRMFSRLRYMIILMGFFAFYCGWIYNDLIGFNYNFFGSCYDPTKPDPLDSNRVHRKQDCVYIFGVDPIWGRAQNQLVYVNSLKMKISVIIAIVHMTFGIVVKALNSLYFRKKLDFYFEFIPQIIFMVVLFGYMDFLIIFKWLKTWDQKVDNIPSTQWAPSIISTMMNIGLNMGKTSDKPDGNNNMWGQRGHSWQDTLQLGILVVAFLCVPIMLLPKPIIQIRKLKRHKKNANPLQSSQVLQSSDSSLERSLLTSQRFTEHSNIDVDSQPISPDVHMQSHAKLGQPSSHAAHVDAGEIFVHQLIQTIQFVLGAVSNTASYLRLWALSLAHSQLAKVFFQKSIKYGIQIPSIASAFPTFVAFWMLCWITFGVLMCMDSMQCFLHSLRLHWVEFQNKFYKGDGYKYQPTSIRLYLQDQKGLENK